MANPVSTIGIIDDDPVFAAVAEMLLFSLGQRQVCTVANTVESLTRFAAAADASSLLILNLHVRGLDGLSVLRELAKVRYPGWIAISANDLNGVLDSAARLVGLLGMRFAGAVQKPMREGDILSLIEVVAKAEPSLQSPDIKPFRDTKIIGLKPVYQPKVDARTGDIVGGETLMRLEAEDGQLLSPFQHIEQMTRKGLLVEETLKFLDLVMADMLGWKRQGLFPVVSFNAPSPVIENPAFLVDFAKKVSSSGISPSQITIELTESVLPEDPATLLETLTRLRIAGFGIALDDFGTGMANFDMLRLCPFSELKIDRSLAQSAVTDPLSCGIIETCATVSRELGMTLTAEGVETEAQELTLKRLGVDVFQGFLFGRGIPANEFAAKLLSEGFGYPQASVLK
ncbi:MAG: EAL domain-containing response regulator [Rhizobiaceae bacterium]